MEWRLISTVPCFALVSHNVPGSFARKSDNLACHIGQSLSPLSNFTWIAPAKRVGIRQSRLSSIDNGSQSCRSNVQISLGGTDSRALLAAQSQYPGKDTDKSGEQLETPLPCLSPTLPSVYY